MAEIGTLTLYREKSIVHRVDELGLDDEGDNEPALTLRSCRVTLPLKIKDRSVNLVVRGQNIPSTLRLTGMVIDQFRRDPNILHDPTAVDWENRYRKSLSPYEADFNQDAWVAIYMEGEIIFSTQDNDPIHEIEGLAAGGEINDSIILEASNNVLGALEDLVVEHDSQTAFVFTPFSTYHRAAVLERRQGRTGSFAVSVYHPTPKKPIRISSFVNFCADMTEGLTLTIFLARVQQMVDDNSIANTPITPAQVVAAKNRKKELMTNVASFERAHKTAYRPERPSFNVD